MSNEITIQLKAWATNPTSSTTAALMKALFEPFPNGVQLTQTTAAVFADTVTATTSDQVISLPTSSKFTAALQGYFCAVNLDATNYVDVGPTSGGAIIPFGRLYPRYPIIIPIVPSIVVRLQANTASCSVQFVWFAK
jgi:hypothetical protein